MSEMFFASQQGRVIPKEDKIFGINNRAKAMIAREGKEIEREARAVKIYSISAKRLAEREYYLDVKCSKGTYIRSLCHDMGLKLGCFAHMAQLQRTRSGNRKADHRTQ